MCFSAIYMRIVQIYLKKCLLLKINAIALLQIQGMENRLYVDGV